MSDVKERQFRIGYEVERLDGLVAAYRSASDDMPALNKTLASAGVPYFTVDTNNVPAATFGRGGGQR